MSIELRMYVLQLSKNVNEKQFNELKYLLVDDVPHGLSEKMKQPHELFHALEQVRKLTPEYLKKAFDAVGRQDLSEDVIQNQHLFQVFSKQYDAPKDEKMSLNGYDAVCDGPAQDNNPHPRKAAVKEGEPIKAHYKPTEKTDDAQKTDMDVDHHQQTDMSVEKKMPQPTTVESMSELHSKSVEGVSELHSTAAESMPELHSKAVEGVSELHSTAAESMPEPQVSGALPDDVVTDVGGEGAGSTTEEASAAMNSNPEIASKSPSEGEAALSDYKKQGARPKDSNPISKAYKAKGPSEQTDHVTTSNQSGSLHSDGSQNKGATPAPPVEKSPPGAAAYMGVGAGSSKGPSESDVDFTSESAVHGSMHAHAQFAKSTTTVVTESHSVSVKLDETGGYSGPLAAAAAAACGTGPAYNMAQLKPVPCYCKEGFLLRIPQGQHCESKGEYGLVIIENGMQFCIEVHNESEYACEVEITLGGRFLGVWLVESGQNNTTVISGSSWEPGLLTFYSQTSAPRRKPERLDIEDNGVIECVFAPEAIKLFVETMKRSSGRHEVVISSKATVGDLIDKLTDTCGITGISCLIYDNKELSRSNPLARYNVKFEDTIRVLTAEEDLEIECPDRDPIIMPVDPRKTCVKEVLVFLQEKLDCPLDMLRLIRKGKKLPLHEKFAQAFVDGEPVVKLQIAEPIDVKVRQPPSEDTKTLGTHTFATLTSLKEQMVETGLMMEGAQLLFNEECLEEDDTMCLTEHGIRNGSVIDIKPPETRSQHRGFGSSTRSFGSAGTRSFDMSSLFGSSGTRGFGGSRGIFDDEMSECSFGVNRQTRGLGGVPDGFSEGRLRLIGDQEIEKNVDDLTRKFERKLGVTLKLKLVSSDPGNFPSLPSRSESGPSSHHSSGQAPAHSSGPTRTKVPPPVPE